MATSESGQGATKIIKMHNEKVIIHNPNPSGNDTKDSIYHDAVEPLIKKALSGKNLTIVTYGQAGTGKTHTLSGNEDQVGIVPLMHSCYRCFAPDLCFKYIDGLSEIVVRSSEDCTKLYEQGSRVKKLLKDQKGGGAARKTDDVYTITIEQQQENAGDLGLRSKIVIASITAPPRKKDSQGSGYELTNKGVNTLHKVVQDLVNSKKRTVIPYRESKITRILQDAFGGNSCTVFIGTVSSSGEKYQETLNTLDFTQSIRSIKNTIKQTEDDNMRVIRELRDEINRLREKLATASTSPEAAVQNKEDIQRLEDMIKDLNVAKRQTWYEKERYSDIYEEERRRNLAEKGMIEWVFDIHKKDTREVKEKLVTLQQEKDSLSLEYKEKRRVVDEMKDDLQNRISEYSKLGESNKRSEEETKQYVNAINEVKEKLKHENEILKDVKKRLRENQEKMKKGKMDAKMQYSASRGNLEIQQVIEAEERKKREKEDDAIIEEELERMKVEIQQEKAEVQLKMAEGIEYSQQQILKLENDLIEMKAERSILTLKISKLQQEKARLEDDINNVYKRHKEAFEIQKLQQFQTFRNYRDVFEQQKATMDQSYRSLLEESIQDAIYLSSRNSELAQENQKLQQEGIRNLDFKDRRPNRTLTLS
ncbi:uncharacterized protein TRIADDRAFT_62201 [Trichoplax adhaerens]|uniref:Kinesin motor domain-containing protein n=1 Tax=Trichoplax adhaerens TaxID=10228 RepID=B3SD45_TRIAD|nr:hypothetical protein TRIADDRAFT_62201 [Trichoplax adhaerens]EDV19336.1 hypothetical protein TRIADDRAFT_62201 [Trichoplax adhaerens]|eukprot:XP_002118187.1 hypothetical protein TRIADDRAFT_62201 [Trichoplax adhaerens]